MGRPIASQLKDAGLALLIAIVISALVGLAFYVYTQAKIKAVESPMSDPRFVRQSTPAEMRGARIKADLQDNIEENNAIIKKIEYIRKRAEIGEILRVQAEDEEKPLQRRLEELADDRKRYEIELYEIETNTWQPR